MEQKYTRKQALAILTAAGAIGRHHAEPGPNRIKKLLQVAVPNRLRQRVYEPHGNGERVEAAQAKRERKAAKQHRDYLRCIGNNPCLRSY